MEENQRTCILELKTSTALEQLKSECKSGLPAPPCVLEKHSYIKEKVVSNYSEIENQTRSCLSGWSLNVSNYFCVLTW